MRWVVDESVARHIVEELRGNGHDVAFVSDLFQSAIDADILDYAVRENRLLLTEDTDFGELLFAQGRGVAPGVVLIRLHSRPKNQKWSRVRSAIEHFGEDLFGRFVVVEEARFRSRKMLR